MSRKKVSGEIQIYSKKARTQIVEIGKNIFSQSGLDRYFNDVVACVDELIKNAVKANYKFVLISNKIFENVVDENPGISESEAWEKVYEIIRNKEEYDRLSANIAETEKISNQVREILNQESIHLRLKNKIFDQKRAYTPEEIEKISGLTDLQKIRKELNGKDIKIIVKFETDDQFIFIEVTNTAPIMAKDLNRIYDKRDEFKIYRDDHREQDFFIKNLDTSDSGFGLGYATIDSFLCNMGLDPYKTIQLLAASDTTVILSFPVEEMRSRV
ncbi:MAG: hypothetical protein JW982_05760 [Spirochaetes bacterium]|nr:hypothetical protein [Spirochaetota bacterium]